MQGCGQEEPINYGETFFLVARLESLRISLAYSSFKGFNVYQIYVKSIFLSGILEAGVYVEKT